MSAVKINHKTEALRNIGGLHDYQSEEGMTDASMLTVAIEAQVHATLALVEQQRIANLIALAQQSYERWGNHAGEAGGMGTLFSYGETPQSSMRIREDIRVGLGLS